MVFRTNETNSCKEMEACTHQSHPRHNLELDSCLLTPFRTLDGQQTGRTTYSSTGQRVRYYCAPGYADVYYSDDLPHHHDGIIVSFTSYRITIDFEMHCGILSKTHNSVTLTMIQLLKNKNISMSNLK